MTFMSRAAFGIVSVALALAPGIIRAADAPPLNVVVLYADDWRHDTHGGAGHPGGEDAPPRRPRHGSPMPA